MNNANPPFDGGPGIPPTRSSPEEAAAAARMVRVIAARLHPGEDTATGVLAMLGLDNLVVTA